VGRKAEKTFRTNPEKSLRCFQIHSLFGVEGKIRGRE
jgi:hypothetical protein